MGKIRDTQLVPKTHKITGGEMGAEGAAPVPGRNASALHWGCAVGGADVSGICRTESTQLVTDSR